MTWGGSSEPPALPPSGWSAPLESRNDLVTSSPPTSALPEGDTLAVSPAHAEDAASTMLEGDDSVASPSRAEDAASTVRGGWWNEEINA